MSEIEEEMHDHEKRLQQRLKILMKQFGAGKITIAEDLQIMDSLKAVRHLPDGSVDLDTVDGLVKSMALATEHLHNREELRNLYSLSEIQNTYFSILEQNFGHFFQEMKKHNVTPHDIALDISSDSSIMKDLVKTLPSFLDLIQEFWKSAGDVAQIHVEDMHSSLKGVFGGALFPAHNENLASKCGIYTDTIILPDPFMRSLDLFERWKPNDKAYYLIKHSLNLLQYKDLACADIEPAIVVIIPDYTTLEKSEKDYIAQLGEADSLTHGSKIFGREFESMDELMDFSISLDTLEKLVPEISDSSRVLFNTDWKSSIKEQISLAMKDHHAELMGTNNPGAIVASLAYGRMCVSNELLIKASRLGGTPIMDEPSSWQYLAWKIEYDAENKERDYNVNDLHVMKGLYSLSENEMEWLGKVPPEALLEMRKVGALEEIRSILGKGIGDLTKSNPLNFYRTSDQIFDNINEAFAQHKKSVQELKLKKWKFAESDIGSWLVVGSLTVAAAATGVPVWGIAAIVADQLLDAPKLKDIPESIKGLANESKELDKSPVGILFRYGQD